ncbi:MAG: hypothetical protein Q9M91_01075 [Candidatus Dojkabacteria bacterium]|nr:hypothetical protein [Candidatus Dojkabacteria bacterium]MDQ7020419.1 hypothetical protein [Candidatus Dojkabacteria bacterium]
MREPYSKYEEAHKEIYTIYNGAREKYVNAAGLVRNGLSEKKWEFSYYKPF